MSDPTVGPVDLEQIEEDERREKIRNRILIGLILLIGLGVAFWVGTLINSNQETAATAQSQTEQAQVEKFNLAQQVADACKDRETLDQDVYDRLCADVETIVREGPQGAQGIPGVQGVPGEQGMTGAQGIRGPPGIDGIDGIDGDAGAMGPAGADGAPGPQGEQGATGDTGPQGEKGDPGAIGPQGPKGEDGEPPVSWVVYGPNDQVIERCERVDGFDPDAPEYTCTRENNTPLP